MTGKTNKQVRVATKHQGVYKQFSAKRRNPKDGKPDESFFVTFKVDENDKKIKKWVSIGWKSEGVTADDGRDILHSIKKQLKTGEPLETVLSRFRKGEPIELDASKLGKPELPPLTFNEAWEIYHEKWLPNLARPSDEIGKYKTHLQPRFGHIPLDKIKGLDLENLKLDLFKSGRAPATIKHALSLVGRIYNKMVAWDYYAGPIPTANIKMPKVDNGRVRYLTHDEADKLMEALKHRSPFWWRIATLSLQTGMRLGEVLALTRGDIDFQGHVAHVQHGKTGSRMVKVNEIAEDALKGALIESKTDLLFPQRNGEPILTSTASHLFSFVVKELGFNPKGTPSSQKVVFHTLRHTFASWLVIEGVPLYTVSKLLGHASLTMTYRYAHLSPDNQMDAVNLLASLTGRNKSRASENQQAA